MIRRAGSSSPRPMPDLGSEHEPDSDAGARSGDGLGVGPDALARVLEEIQRRGGIGRVPIDDAIAHARQFVVALPIESGVLLDLGSGGGLPGLVIAVEAPAWHVVLVERR